SVVEDDFAAGLGRGAPLAQGAVATQRAERRHPSLADRAGVAGRTGHRARLLVDDEVINGEPTLDRRPQRLRLDHGLVAVGVSDRATEIPGAISGIAVPGTG